MVNNLFGGRSSMGDLLMHNMGQQAMAKPPQRSRPGLQASGQAVTAPAAMPNPGNSPFMGGAPPGGSAPWGPGGLASYLGGQSTKSPVVGDEGGAPMAANPDPQFEQGPAAPPPAGWQQTLAGLGGNLLGANMPAREEAPPAAPWGGGSFSDSGITPEGPPPQDEQQRMIQELRRARGMPTATAAAAPGTSGGNFLENGGQGMSGLIDLIRRRMASQQSPGSGLGYSPWGPGQYEE